uniref:RNA polymerase beta subunit n=1 Tax=Streptofilum capillatum TaxID=2058781 RepID=UPI00286C0317|nr:RNA polymerase beta subunit [Streptofilum capillatum]WKT08503.1 RNA polymerase beta subunit [Streptofilum capillatum]
MADTVYRFSLPDLTKVQRQSFHRFLERGLEEELSFFPIIRTADHSWEFQLLAKEYQLEQPRFNEWEALDRGITYASHLYIPVQIVQRSTKESYKQAVFLGIIPLMNSQGTFIINGSARAIVNQIVRCAGVYYTQRLDPQGRKTFIANFICHDGPWFKLEIDPKARLWVRLGRGRKGCALSLLVALGFTCQQILSSVQHSETLQASFSRKSHFCTQTAAILELYHQLFPEKPVSLTEARRVISTRILNPSRYALGKIGRRRINQRLGLKIAEDVGHLVPQDVLAAVDCLLSLYHGIGTLDDVDHLKNRRVRLVGELLQNQWRRGLDRLERSIRENVLTSPPKISRIASLVNPKPLVATWRELFASNPLSQFMDQTNPLAEVTHKRRLSCLGPGGLTRERAGFAVRDIHPSHYGRICPIETPEGPNAGLIGSLATYAQVNSDGFLEAPFYKVLDGHIAIDQGVIYLSAEQEEVHFIAPGDLLVSYKNGLKDSETITPARYRQEFVSVPWNQINFVGVSPVQYFSVATSLIPFLEHDDANRALMGSNMQRQAVPLLRPERPIVGTGLEAQVAFDSGTLLLAEAEGTVILADGQTVTIEQKDGNLRSYNLQGYRRTNQDTCSCHKLVVQKGQRVQRGQILADGASTVWGELALGQNILIAYMPWEGYNFEDAIVISERLVYENVYTSLHIEKHEIEARLTHMGPEIITHDIPSLNEHLLRHLDVDGIVRIGSWVEPGDVLVGKITPREDSDLPPEGRLLRAIFGEKAGRVRDSSLKVPNGTRGRVIDVRRMRGGGQPFSTSYIVHVYILQKRQIQVGDKVSGRHGNKGIVCKILPRQDMPYAQDGTPVDMVLNPLGVPSRMNVGQIFECLLGLAGKHLGKHYRVTAFDEIYEKDASRKLTFSELYKARKETGHRWLFEPDSPGKSFLLDGRTGEPFRQQVTVGMSYILKLVHLVDDKIHARSTGPYSLVTQQPLGGRSRQGGQRLGEMEVWALEGFGSAFALQEFLTVKSDDVRGRNDALNALIKGENIPKPSVPEAFKVLIGELRSLCLEIQLYKIGEGQRGLASDLIEL